jgi:hypothetical protein
VRIEDEKKGDETIKAAKKTEALEERKTTVVEITVQAEEIVEGAEYQGKEKTEVVGTEKGDGETTVVGVVEVVM